jgi:hypothetical protein
VVLRPLKEVDLQIQFRYSSGRHAGRSRVDVAGYGRKTLGYHLWKRGETPTPSWRSSNPLGGSSRVSVTWVRPNVFTANDRYEMQLCCSTSLDNQNHRI